MTTPHIPPDRLAALRQERAALLSKAQLEAAAVRARVEIAEDFGARLAAEVLTYDEICTVARSPLNASGVLDAYLHRHRDVIAAALGPHAFEDSHTQRGVQTGVRRVLDQITPGV